MPSLLLTKFYLPPAPAGFVARPRLFEKLDEALAHRLTLVSAQAGSGKTTLVSAWAQLERKKGTAIVWLSLDEADNAPQRFMEYLVACFEEGGAKLDLAMLPGNDRQVLAENFLPDIIHGLAPLKREFVLILDDYHLIHNQEIHTALGYLLEHMPPCLHIVMMTRSDPPLELARLRVAGQLAEVRMAQLRFSTQEAAAFLKAAGGVYLAETDVVALNTRAEGWIAGLQLAAISLRGREDIQAFITAFAGSHRFVFDYLLEEVLNQQTPQVREFLLKTSLLERLSAPLCDAVAEAGGAARSLLDELERANLFLTPLDDERNWYRYHHLFSDLLRVLLEQTYPGMAEELHRRACRWYEAQAMIPEALHHALAAGDMEWAVRLVSANVLALVEHAELAPVLLRMDAAPRELREASPWLGIAHAWALAYTGQMERARAALTRADRQLDRLPDDERDRAAGHIAAVRAYAAWVHGSQQAAVDLAESAAHLLPGEEIAVRALNLTTLGNSLNQYEADPRSVDVLEQAVVLAQQAGQSHVFMLAASALAYAYSGLGRLHKAYAVCMEAIETAEAYQLRTSQPFPSAASVFAELAGILGEWGDTERSIQVARKGLALSELWGQTDSNMFCLLRMANALSLAHDFEAARQVLPRARKTAQKVSPWFVLNVDQVELGIWLDAGDLHHASRSAHEQRKTLPISLETRLLVKQSRLDEALSILERALPDALLNPSLQTVRLGVSQSMALYLKKDHAGALSALKMTLELAEPEKRVATFVREGDVMEKLLHLARGKSITPEYTRRLLEAFEARRKPIMAPSAETLIEPLSEREMEILKMLDGPLSTPEIAAQLVVSANTVRTHIKNIYSKLGVHGRSGAVRRAKELGLMP